jgi:Restriction endonuclease
MAARADWRRLEERVKRWFLQCGCAAEKMTIGGPGSVKYEIDCVVTFKTLGLPVKWIVECKDWKARTPQDVVASLRQRVTDTGADKGILVCPAGFQLGALRQADVSSVTLVTPDRLEEILFAEFRKLALQTAYSQIRQLRDTIVDYRLKLEDYLYAYEDKRNIEKEHAAYDRLLGLIVVLSACQSHLESWEAGRASLGPPDRLPQSRHGLDFKGKGKVDFADDRAMLLYVLSYISQVRDRVTDESRIVVNLPGNLPTSPMAPEPIKGGRYVPTPPKKEQQKRKKKERPGAS